jgi:hypothetical protein
MGPILDMLSKDNQTQRFILPAKPAIFNSSNF